jgi:hypothetical protein
VAGELLKKGILCRGGVARGLMYHADGIAFGEGLVRAYDLERKVAKNPRIVIADEVAPTIFFRTNNPIPLIKRDADGEMFLNVFSHFWLESDGKSSAALVGASLGLADEPGLLLVRQRLESALSRAQTRDPGILEKIRWEVRQFK